MHADISNRSNVYFARLNLIISLDINGENHSTMDVKSVGKEYMGWVGGTDHYSRALMKALQQATKKSVPQIIKELE